MESSETGAGAQGVPVPTKIAPEVEENVRKGQAPTPRAVSLGLACATRSAGFAGRSAETAEKRRTKQSGHVDLEYGSGLGKSQKIDEGGRCV